MDDFTEYLTPDELVELDVLLTASAQRWEPLPGPQTIAYNSEADIIGFGGAAGGGKALASDTPILTPYGMRAIGDLRVGDSVLAADGTRTQVIGVFPQGVRSLYRVTFQDGASLLADVDHKWNYCIARKGKWRKSGCEWKVGTTSQLQTMMGNGRRLLIPVAEPLRFTKSYRVPQRLIDPYVLGLLLGDGYTAQQGAGAKWSFATEDAELLAALPGDWVQDIGCNYRLRGDLRPILQNEFKRLGLAGCKAATKFIPEPYKWAPIEDRWALLQGLMDTDGTAADGKAYFCSISKQLAEDVQWLVHTLGGRASITSRIPVCTNGANGSVQGAQAWQVYIRLPDNSQAFRLERKKVLAKCDKPVKRRITSIEYECEGDAVCIAVDHPDSLYVAGTGCVVTHNSDLACGKALTQHRKVMILRRIGTELTGIVDRLEELIGSRDGYNGQSNIWRTKRDDGVPLQIEFGAVPNAGDERKYQGRPHDLLVFDEAANFLPLQVRFLLGWKRTTIPGQRAQALMTFNPPTSAEGRWVIDFFAPWLDDKFPNPAEPGELRYAASLPATATNPNGRDMWVDSPRAFIIGVDGLPCYDFDPKDYDQTDIIRPESRTFIPSRITDNPHLLGTGYMTTLQAMPEPLRSQMLKGDFSAGILDDPWQVIPTEWVEQAMARWLVPARKEPMTLVGVDVARGGKDETVIARRHGMWFDKPLAYPGKETPDGPMTSALIIAATRDSAPVAIDAIGVGSSPLDFLRQAKQQVLGVNVAEKATGLDKTARMKFYNQRSELWWRMREALDPTANTGIALPPDPRLKADLCAPKWTMQGASLRVEGREDIQKRIGRSPDYASAYCLALMDIPKIDDLRAINGSGGFDYDPVNH